MADQLSLYNLALMHLRESPLVSLTENREARRVLDVLYPEMRREMLEAGFWKFAIKSTMITQDTAIVPAFGYRMAFNKPADWVKTYDVSFSEYFNPPSFDWIEESNLIFADGAPLYLRFVSNSDIGYGHDIARWTSRFTTAFAFKLAWRAAPKVTGSSDNMKADLEKDFEKALSFALSFEALREPSKRPPQGAWNASRHRFSGQTGRR
jgi:hypothetical protein